MNELERLARWHQAMADEPKRNQEKREKHAQTAAILLAASKVDVAGLMELAGDYANAIGAFGAASALGLPNTTNEIFSTAAFDKLETALRMALAGREWQPIETVPTGN